MLICPAIGDTDPIRYHRPTPDGQFSGNIFDEAMRPLIGAQSRPLSLTAIDLLKSWIAINWSERRDLNSRRPAPQTGSAQNAVNELPAGLRRDDTR
jgi:hypothetical protein